MGILTLSLAQQPPTGPPVHVPSAEEFSEQELEAFAEAYVALEDLQANQEETSPGGDPAFSSRMRQEIQSRGLTVERYKRISTAMNRDMTLRTKVKRLINDVGQAQ